MTARGQALLNTWKTECTAGTVRRGEHARRPPRVAGVPHVSCAPPGRVRRPCIPASDGGEMTGAHRSARSPVTTATRADVACQVTD